MSNKSQSFLEALEVQLSKQDQELAAVRECMAELPPDMEFAIPEDALMTDAPPAELAPIMTAHIRA